MAILELPMPQSPNEVIRVGLEGVTYQTLWIWNERDSHWSLSFLTADGTPIVSGLRVVIGWDLLLNVSNEVAPPGRLLFFDLSTSDETLTGTDPGLNDLGDRVQGYYVESGS